MSDQQPRLLVTGATGELGRLVIAALIETVPASRIIAGVRDTESATATRLATLGVELRIVDYARPESLAIAFQGVGRLLLISSNALGERAAQHRNVITAARGAGVSLIAYTSVLHADASPLGLAAAHRETEADLRPGGVPWVLLRNGWYTENYTASIPATLAHGVQLGSARE